MKELDVVMLRYLENNYQSATAADQERFLELLQMPDPDLYNLLLGRDLLADSGLASFVQQLRSNPETQ